MSEAALMRISQLIKQEDDLNKIGKLKQQFIKEKSAIDIKLNQTMNLQIEAIMENLKNLNDSSRELNNIKGNMTQITGIYKESQTAISKYDIIKKMTQVNTFFTQSDSLYRGILEFHGFLNYISELIDAEGDVEIDNPVNNLFKIHYNLNHARNFQENLLQLAATSTDDMKSIINKITAPIYSIIEKFDHLLGEIVSGLSESLKEQNRELVIKLIKMIEYEEREDLKLQLLVKLTEQKVNVKVNNLDLTNRLQVRNYKNMFFDKIDESVKEIFDNCESSFENKMEIFENLDWIFNDLIFVKEELTKLTPERWNIFQFYHDCYYKYLNALILRIIESEPAAEELLVILNYDKSFAYNMNAELGIPKKKIKSVIGDKLKETLLDDYLKLILQKMHEWVSTLETTEQGVFRKRDIPPELHGKETGLQGSVIVFQMFSQQADVAADSGYGKILCGVVKEFARLIIERQKNWTSLVQAEITNLVNDEEVNPGLTEYLVALGNDQMKGANYTEVILDKYSKLVSSKYQEEIVESLNLAIDGFADLAKYCCDGLIVIIFNDMRRIFDVIFSKEWYNNNLLPQIGETMMEYLVDFKETMDVTLFELVLESCIDSTIFNYLKPLKNGNNFKMKKLEALVSRDVEVLYKLFIQFTDENFIQEKFKVFEYLLDLSQLEKELIMDKWRNEILLDFNDCPTDFVEGILMCRKDLEKSKTNALVSELKSVKASFESANEIKPSFMGKFKLWE